MVKLCIDNRESNKRIESACQFFDDKYDIEIGTYPVGDFIFENRVCFEYKTANDELCEQSMISHVISA